MERVPEPCVPAYPNPSWIGLALSRTVVVRATGYMLIVGGILIAINHGDAILRGEFDAVRIAKMLVTPLVPYLVSTLSSVSALRGAREAASETGVPGDV